MEGLPILESVLIRFLPFGDSKFQYPEGWKAFRYLAISLWSILGSTNRQMFQYPEGWKAFRYMSFKYVLFDSELTLTVSIPRRVEGLPIPHYSTTLNLDSPVFQYPEGWKAFRYCNI